MSTHAAWYQNPTTLLDTIRLEKQIDARLDLPGYTDLREVQRGGQGVVFQAVQTSTRRPVAIKVLYEDALAFPERRVRFEREIEVISALRHPGIVSVYDSGVTSDGRLYYVMEYVTGLPLHEALRAWPDRDPARRLTLAAKICDAIGYAHLHGVMHRDIKPSNILIDDQVEPRVVDFGVAKLPGHDQPGRRTLLTETGRFIGTLAYASPEQLDQSPARTDLRSDVYSLGVVVYEMLTGAPPYPVDGSMAQIIDAIRSAEPPPPSKALKKRLAAGQPTPPLQGLDAEVDTIVLKALAKDPERRYQSAQALGADIKRFLKGELIEARRDSGWYVLSKTLRRYKAQTALATALALILVASSVLLSVLYRQSTLEAAKANQIKVFLEDTLASVEASPDRVVTVREVLDEAVQWIQIALSDQPEVEASLRTTVGNSYRSLGEFDRAGEQLAQAHEIRKRMHGPRHPLTLESRNALGLLARDRGNLEQAQMIFEQVLADRLETLGRYRFETALALQNLADVLTRQGRLGTAEQLLRESLRIREALRTSSHPDVAIGRFLLANALAAQGESAEAIRLHESALQIRLNALPPEHPDVARSQRALAALLIDAGQPRAAEVILRECLRAQMQSLPQGHWQIARTHSLLSRCLQALGRLDEAQILGKESYETLLREKGSRDSKTVEALHQFAAVLDAAGRNEEAKALRATAPTP